MNTPNTLPANGGVSDAEVEAALQDMRFTATGIPKREDMRRALEAFVQSRQPSAQGGERVDLRGVDGGDVSEWQHLIKGGYVPKDTVLIRAADAHLAVTPLESRSSIAPPPAGGGKEALSEHQIAVRLHDFPALSAFHQKHAMGPLAAPSCLCCGKSTQGVEIGVQHMELPGVVICAPCKTAASQGVTAAPQEGVSVPPGWKLVPIEPTKEMWAAVNKLDDEMAAGGYDGKGCSIEQAWNCLVDTAPQPPASAPPATGNVGAIPAGMTEDGVMALARTASSENHYAGGRCVRMEFTPANILAFVAALPPPGRGMVPSHSQSFAPSVLRWHTLSPHACYACNGPCTLHQIAIDALVATKGNASARKPLTNSEIKKAYATTDQGGFDEFVGGVKFAEAHHGIKEGSATPLGDGEGAR